MTFDALAQTRREMSQALQALSSRIAGAPPSRQPGLADAARLLVLAVQALGQGLANEVLTADAALALPRWPRRTRTRSAPDVGDGRPCVPRRSSACAVAGRPPRPIRDGETVMARAPTSKTSPPRKPAPAAVPPPAKVRPVRRLVGRMVLHGLAFTALLGGVAYAATICRAYIEQQPAVAELTVEVENRPAWMSDYLTRQIAGSVPRHAASPFDQQLLRDAAARLAANPWVRQVRQVRRKFGQSAGDTLVIDCEYRAPVALVRWRDAYWLVDNDGYKLPAPFAEAELPQVTASRDGHTALRVVTGVRQPPPADGHRWTGDDLSAALDLAKLFHGKGYLDGVTGIDVANYGGRLGRAEPQVVLATKYDTQVWWGRPVLDGDFYVEVPVARKLATLRAVVKQFGRVDAGKPWLDVRFDTGLLPSDPPPADVH